MGPPLQGVKTSSLIRHASRAPLPLLAFGLPPVEGRLWSTQMGRKLDLCGTFRYIYWKLGRSAPVRGRVAAMAAPTVEFGQKTRAHNVRPYTAFTNGSICRKRDRSGTYPLKPRSETQFRTKFLCLLSFSKKVRGPGLPPGPLTCVCCKGEGEMGDIDFFWVRSYHNRKIRRNRVRIMNFL